MNSPNNNFETLQRALRLKRHERPPPRYFHEFSGRIITRLRAAENAEPRSWWERLGFEFDFKPALTCSGAAIACGLVVYAMVFSLVTDADSNPAHPGDTAAFFAAPGAGIAAGKPPLVPSAETLLASSTNAVLAPQSVAAPFTPVRLDVIPASFTPGR